MKAKQQAASEPPVSWAADLSEALLLLSGRSLNSWYVQQTQGHIESFEIVTESLLNKARIAALSPDKPMVSARRRAWDTIDYLHLEYSAGLPVDRLAPFFPLVVEWWEEYAVYDKAYDKTPQATSGQAAHMHMHDDGYWQAIRLTSFALLLGHADLPPRIAALWDYANPEMDGLLERLVAPFAPDRTPPPDKCTRHLPYFKLLKVFAADPDSAQP